MDHNGKHSGNDWGKLAAPKIHVNGSISPWVRYSDALLIMFLLHIVICTELFFLARVYLLFAKDAAVDPNRNDAVPFSVRGL